MKRYLPPLLWILGFQAVSALIGVVTQGNMAWYETLEKSSLTPPDIAFPIVWTCLYIMLAIAGYLVWKKREQRDVFILFWVQMLLNWGWSFVFFGAHLVIIGFFWIVLFDLAMLAFIVKAWRANKPAALLVLPTLVWGSFAAYLNYMIWILN